MEFKKEVVVYKCDVCGEVQNYIDECVECGKHLCYDCTNTHGVQCHAELWVSSSGSDSYYCDECNAKDCGRLHQLYKKVKDLNDEYNRVIKDIHQRDKNLKNEINLLLSERFKNE